MKSLGRDGKVLRHFDDDTFEVAVGPMKMKIARDDIASVVARPAEIRCRRRARAASTFRWLARMTASPTEINVIGQTVDEATQRWRNLWIALSWRVRSRARWCMAAAWGSCAKRCGSF